jgi:tetratricopeptide (TPR) repeat protein
LSSGIESCHAVSAAFAASIDELDELISRFEDTLSTLPRSTAIRTSLFLDLAKTRLLRYRLSGDEQDIDTLTLQFTLAIFLPSHSPCKYGLHPASALCHLSEALLHRALKSEQLSDVRYCIKCFHFLRGQSLVVIGLHHDAAKHLLLALALQLKIEPPNEAHVQVVEEMSILCSELLASDLADKDLIEPVTNFARGVYIYNGTSKSGISPQVIECLREASNRLPGLHDVSRTFAYSLFIRFNASKSHNDYEDAMATVNKIFASHSTGDVPSEYVYAALYLAAGLALCRLTFYWRPDNLEEAIFRMRDYVSKVPLDATEHRPILFGHLEALERTRLEEFGHGDGPQEEDSSDIHHDIIMSILYASGPMRPAIIQFLQGFERRHDEVNAIQGVHQVQGDSGVDDDIPVPHDPEPLSNPDVIVFTSMTVEDLLRHSQMLDSMNQITDIGSIEEAIKYCRHSLSFRFPDGSIYWHVTMAKLTHLLHRAFLQTSEPEYLNQSIAANRIPLKMPRSRYVHFEIILRLTSSLFIRLLRLGDIKDLDEMMELFPIAATNTHARASRRFEMSCKWAQIARASRHHSTLTAYESALSLMQDTLEFAPTLESQHFRIVKMRDEYKTLPLDYVSYMLQIGQLEKAIETLQRGRSLLWSEMRGLRTPLDHVRAVDSPLAERFSAINRDLEALATSGSTNLMVDDGEGMDPFGRIIMKRRKLSDERKAVITQIRSLPGFENFLMALSFDTLRSAAACGPVIIINHSMWRSDIVILLHNHSPCVITTSDDFYDSAIELRDRLVNTRKQYRLESRQYQHALRYVLQGLYDLVGCPVIAELRRLKIPKQSRVWWCPTSVFCSLPLHAMGPIPSDDGRTRYFLDLFIPSYTPTSSTLIESRKFSRQSVERPSLLLVAQPDGSLANAWPEIWHVQRLGTKVTSLISKRATPPAVVEGLRDHQFAHFVCHGTLESGKPFDASFQLYGGQRLTLLDIVRS